MCFLTYGHTLNRCMWVLDCKVVQREHAMERVHEERDLSFLAQHHVEIYKRDAPVHK